MYNPLDRKIIVFTIPMRPRGKMRHRSAVVQGHVRSYKHPAQVGREQKWLPYFIENAPEEPWGGPIFLRVEAFYPIPKSLKKADRVLAERGKLFPTVKPDIKNLVAMIEDIGNEIIWKDDKLIVGHYVRKFYSLTPRIIIEVEELYEEGGHL